MIGVDDLELSRDTVQALLELGYEGLGEAGVAGRLYFRVRGGGSFNVAVVAHGGVHWTNNRRLRDFLRAHPGEAERYAAHKLAVVDAGARTLLTYSQEKGPFVSAILERARATAG